MTAAPTMPRGKFITLEGVDGAGKSTHLEAIAGLLRRRGKDVVVTREPGGTPLGEKLRQLLLTEPMHVETETLLMFAARREHIAQVIAPALEQDRWVVSDRFTDATYAYQGGGRGVPADKIAVLERWVQDTLRPDLTLILDVPVELARSRLGRGRPDRFEHEDPEFFRRVRAGYRERAAMDPSRVRLVDGSPPVEEVKKSIAAIIAEMCAGK